MVGSGNMPMRRVNTYRVVKLHKRLWIEEVETGELVYTPPDFMRHRLQSREPMRALAQTFTAIGCRDIGAIVEFQASYGPRIPSTAAVASVAAGRPWRG